MNLLFLRKSPVDYMKSQSGCERGDGGVSTDTTFDLKLVFRG